MVSAPLAKIRGISFRLAGTQPHGPSRFSQGGYRKKGVPRKSLRLLAARGNPAREIKNRFDVFKDLALDEELLQEVLKAALAKCGPVKRESIRTPTYIRFLKLMGNDPEQAFIALSAPDSPNPDFAAEVRSRYEELSKGLVEVPAARIFVEPLDPQYGQMAAGQYADLFETLGQIFILRLSRSVIQETLKQMGYGKPERPRELALTAHLLVALQGKVTE